MECWSNGVLPSFVQLRRTTEGLRCQLRQGFHPSPRLRRTRRRTRRWPSRFESGGGMGGKRVRNPVSRILYPPERMAFIYLTVPKNGSLLPGCDQPETIGWATPFPIWSCTGLGLSCLLDCSQSGGLLPHLFTLTPRLLEGRFVFCDTFRHFALRRNAPAFTGNPALWCPDFPLPPSESERPGSEQTRLQHQNPLEARGIPRSGTNQGDAKTASIWRWMRTRSRRPMRPS